MKRLFQFTLPQTVTKTVEEKSKDKDGNEVTTTREASKEVDQVITLKKPNRVMYDDAELYYGVTLSEGIKAGLLTRALLSKRFSNDGGVMSNEDKEDYADLYLALFNNQTEIERLSGVTAKKRTEQESEKFSSLMKRNGVLKREIQDFELAQASLFEQTAENRARNKTVLWWVLRMAHIQGSEEDNSEPIPIFSGGSHKERLDSYDGLEELPDPFYEELLKKLVYYVSYWYVGNVQTEEEFKRLLSDLEESGLEEASMEAIEEAGIEKESAKKTDTSQKKDTKKKKTKKEAPVEEAPAETPAEEPPAEDSPEDPDNNE